jgi:two-component system nitrate/nitrite response regulator NarL
LVAAGTNIRLVIASSVRLVREGLARSLRERRDVTVVSAVDLSPAGIARIADARVDVVLVDVGQTESIAAVARLIKTASADARLVAFGLDEIDDRLFACAAAGFSGFVSSESGGDELHRALIDVMEGRIHCAPHIVTAIFNRLASLSRELSRRGSLPSLTSREREILALAAQSRTNKEIASELGITSSTVKNHMHNILQKLQVTRRGQAVARLRAHRRI